MTVVLNVGIEWPIGSLGREADAIPRGEAIRRGATWRGAIGAALLSLLALDAAAIGLGTATLDSGLGEPLRFSLPVTVEPDEEIGCIQVRTRGDTLPAAFRTRSSVIRSGGQTRIEVASAAPVNDPAVGVVVSVGCTSAISREFVFFLDPPAVPALASTPPAARSVVQPTVPRGLAAARSRAPDALAGGAVGERSTAAPPPRNRPRRTRPRPSAAPAPSMQAARPGTGAVSAPRPTATAPSGLGRDRLSVVPTEGPAAAAPATTAPPPVAQSAPTTAAPAPLSSPAATIAPATVPPPAAGAPTAPAAQVVSDPEAGAREQALRDQQAALQAQVKTLSDQIAALRVQTTALVARNQALLDRHDEGSPLLLWLLAALAALATLLAAWMAWRYLRLRRSVEGSPWWSGHTAQAGAMDTSLETRFNDSQLSALDQGTRFGARAPTATDALASSVLPSAPAAPQAVERPRPAARPQAYPPAIETDFTVSDIEAAMATVRTVAPARKPGQRLDDTDFAPLGGPTMPSPFTKPPPIGPRTQSVIDREAFEPVQPIEISGTPPPAPPIANPTMDFKLEIPTNFDPLSTDSHKRTEVDRVDPGSGVAFSPPQGHGGLDFELPSTTAIAPLAPADDGPRHGATALDNLFATDTGKLGPDTILALDDSGAPLSTTEVERLTGPDAAEPAGAPPPAQGRMAHFAELMNQVDETAQSDALRAIAQLRQYVLRDETIPTLLWLKLFELYKAVDKRPVYEALAEHFTRRYRRPMIGWDETLADRVPQTPLSAFQQLDTEIERSWGTQGGLDRLQTLLCGRDQSDAVVFNAVLQRDLLDAAKIYLLDRDSSISATRI